MVAFILITLYFCFSSLLSILGVTTIVVNNLKLLFAFLCLPFCFGACGVVLGGSTIVIGCNVLVGIIRVVPCGEVVCTRDFRAPLTQVFNITTIELGTTEDCLLITRVRGSTIEDVVSFLTRKMHGRWGLSYPPIGSFRFFGTIFVHFTCSHYAQTCSMYLGPAM